tara:strand:- start:1264 stop:1995 length:732 start_codon:yes stop_codon:yes gene_type:complete
MKKISSCHAYLASLVDVGQNFKSICEVKTRSMINACGETPDVVNDRFLVIGPNIIPFGLNAMGADVTKLNGLSYYGDAPCTCKDHDGELADFVAQGIQFDWVIAPDEWITYAETEEQQKQMLSLISKIARKGFFTTIKDYKNMYANQRYFEEPFVLRTDTGDAISIRKREWDNQDRQAWDQHAYIIHDEELYMCDVTRRRTMYFKQLAKFTSDLGATRFSVEKQNMYKPAFSKTFEYVVCIKF